jgi:hypothetical protein
MIPGFQENGFLPPGIHPSTLAELAHRFGRQSELRRVQTESIGWLIELSTRAGVERVVINGSYVTDVLEPNDVDCVLLIGEDFPEDVDAEAELIDGLPFLEISLVTQEGFSLLVDTFFATDREQVPKGMVEILL